MAQAGKTGSPYVAELLDLLAEADISDSGVRFPHLIGQERIKDVLSRAAETGRNAHAYLFLGEDGVGKEAAALDFARVLLCKSDGERHSTPHPLLPCEKCDSCVQSAKLTHPGLRILFPQPKPQPPKEGQDGVEAVEQYTAAQRKQIDGVISAKVDDYYSNLAVGSSSEILIEHIRSIRQEFRLTSYSGGWRIVLVSRADRLRVQAANAFLKLLEEPPKDVVFILTSSRESRILPTILSRCQVIRFPRVDRDVLRTELIERLKIKPEKAEAATRLANGSWKQAVEWAKGDPAKETKKVVELLRDLLRGDPGKLDELVDYWGAASRSDSFAGLLDRLSHWLRDVQRFDADPNSASEFDSDEHLVKFATFTEGRNFEDALSAIDEARLDIERHVQTSLIAHTLFYKLRKVLFSLARDRA
jgi:DNA polymerase III subunit delta'